MLKTSKLKSTIAALLVSASLAGAALADAQRLDIPAGSLLGALETLAKQANVDLVYQDEQVKGLKTKGVSGELSANEAVIKLLEGTPLTVRRDPESGAILITPRSSSGPEHEDTTSSLRGQIDEIVVTGTNIRGVSNPTVPIIQYDRSDIEYSGSRTAQDFLQTIPQNFAGNSSLYSGRAINPFKSVTNNSGSSGVDLRGLGAGSTLTLLNGRRIPATETGQFVDVSTLPLAIIDRIDVQTDGASAIYGSDAIGGVINFVTRRDFTGLEVSGSAGSVTSGGKQDYQGNIVGGFGWGSGSAVLNLGYTDTGKLAMADRPFIGQSDYGTLAGGDILPDEELWSGYASIAQDLGERTSFTIDALYTQRDHTSTTSMYNRVQHRVFSIDNYFVTAQLNSDLTDDWNVGVYADYGANSLEESQNRVLNTGQNFNLFLFENDILTLEGRVSGKLFDIYGGKVSVALGASYREEGYRDASPPNGRFDPDITRRVKAAYGEVMVPFVGVDNEVPFVRQLQLSVAGRYEEYSDFGTTFNPRYGLFWEPVEGLGVRASYSESFRAPPLYSIGNRPQLAILGMRDPLYTGTPDPRLAPGTVYAAAIYGANSLDGLTEETADSVTLGLTFEPRSLPGLSAELSYFEVSYKDRIQFVSPDLAAGNPAYENLIDRSPDPAYIQSLIDRAMTDDSLLFYSGVFDINGNQLPVVASDVQVFFDTGTRNLSIVDVRGMDLSAKYSLDTSFGRWSFGFNGSLLMDYKTALSPQAAPVEGVDQIYRPVEFKARGTVAWSQADFTVFTALNYIDNYTDTLSDPMHPVGIASWTTVDLTLSYGDTNNHRNDWLDRTRLSLTVQNLFDKDPPYANTVDGLNFDSTNASPLGRFVILRFTKGLLQ